MTSLTHCPICDNLMRETPKSFMCWQHKTHNFYFAKNLELIQVQFDNGGLGHEFMKHPDLEPFNAHCMAWQFKNHLDFEKAIPAFIDLNKIFQNFYLLL